MYTRSDQCSEHDEPIRGGMGLIHKKDLASAEEMYGRVRLFSHMTVDPGCSIGYHTHTGETEFYYILKGEAVFNDDGAEVVLRAGDVGATGHGRGHSLENRSSEPVELIALIVLE